MQWIKQYRNKIAFEKILAPVEPKFEKFHFENKTLERFLNQKKIKLYSHQVKGLKAVKEGKNIVVTTPTASGKSFIYIFSVLERLHTSPDAKALVIFPLKALARDQYMKIKELITELGIPVSVNVYDGDTPKEERQQIKRNPPNFLITTPDMLNVSILPYHNSWSWFYENLDFVVLDEVHTYRGILGSHVANIIKRLKRVVNYYKSKKPVFIMNSATIHNPAKFASKLITDEVYEISNNGAGTPEREVKIFRKIKTSEISQFIADLVQQDISTIAFVDSRKETELLTLRIKEALQKIGREDLVEKVTPYRSGYTPQERREIEFKIMTRNVLAVVSTSALELGIDIGELDCCVLVGYPGTLAQVWQRFGRAGRRDKKAYNILFPKRNALDQYFVKNPQELFKRQMEEPVINPENEYILKKHIPFMAKELPIKISELSEKEKEVARILYKEKVLEFKNQKLYAKRQPPFSIRSAGDTYTIVDIFKKKNIGTIPDELVIYETHPGAIYLHNGERFLVESIDEDSKIVYVAKTSNTFITEPLKESNIEIKSIEERQTLGKLELFYGKVKVQTFVIGYSVRDFDNGEKLQDFLFSSQETLSREFETEAFWFTIPLDWEDEIISRNLRHNLRIFYQFLKKKEYLYTGGNIYADIVWENILKYTKTKDKQFLSFIFSSLDSVISKFSQREREEIKELKNRILDSPKSFLGAIHGVEHALIGIYPLFAMNDRWDIGGLSTNFFSELGKPTIFIYDGYEGGVGYSKVGFKRLPEMINSVYKNISKCSCMAGCPSCIYSPKCGNSNDYLDKTASILLAHKLKKELPR
ncbi:MAG: DEAD/DEAH box helicase [Aquificae bacterium]|nr:DEAD/DEAH box helicase [Aquificota bacterium]